jgi:hypothetical protein
LEKRYRKLCEEKGEQNELRMGEDYFKKYRETGEFGHVLTLYTAETPFYGIVRDDETFLVEMYKHLLRYEKLTFRGCTYRDFHLLPEDFEPYRWALAHPRSLLEMRKITSTTQIRKNSLQFLENISSESRSVLLEITFNEKCFTALDLQTFSYFKNEKEVLVLSGTFFEVTQIREVNEGLTIISLKHVPVDKDILSAAI